MYDLQQARDCRVAESARVLLPAHGYLLSQLAARNAHAAMPASQLMCCVCAQLLWLNRGCWPLLRHQQQHGSSSSIATHGLQCLRAARLEAKHGDEPHNTNHKADQDATCSSSSSVLDTISKAPTGKLHSLLPCFCHQPLDLRCFLPGAQAMACATCPSAAVTCLSCCSKLEGCHCQSLFDVSVTALAIRCLARSSRWRPCQRPCQLPALSGAAGCWPAHKNAPASTKQTNGWPACCAHPVHPPGPGGQLRQTCCLTGRLVAAAGSSTAIQNSQVAVA